MPERKVPYRRRLAIDDIAGHQIILPNRILTQRCVFLMRSSQRSICCVNFRRPVVQRQRRVLKLKVFVLSW
jgi:hypothetical protein